MHADYSVDGIEVTDAFGKEDVKYIRWLILDENVYIILKFDYP